MNPLNIVKLDLRAPLYYIKDEEIKPFEYTLALGETLFCFEIAPEQSLHFEPDQNQYLNTLLWGGKRNVQPDLSASLHIELPKGNYLFAQQREILTREESIWTAIEIQKEGLWERLLLANRCYLRYLFEDGAGVTQIFRPYSSLR